MKFLNIILHFFCAVHLFYKDCTCNKDVEKHTKEKSLIKKIYLKKTSLIQSTKLGKITLVTLNSNSGDAVSETALCRLSLMRIL